MDSCPSDRQPYHCVMLPLNTVAFAGDAAWFASAADATKKYVVAVLWQVRAGSSHCTALQVSGIRWSSSQCLASPILAARWSAWNTIIKLKVPDIPKGIPSEKLP